MSDRRLVLIGPAADALLLWGAPLEALLIVLSWLHGLAVFAPPRMAGQGTMFLFAAIAWLTWAHLIAVAPRAYLNREVFSAYRRRLVVVPILLLALLLVSPTALVIAGVVGIAWDVHHSAMQNFGFSRLYDMKAGNPPALLRATDLRLNWLLYVGPLFAGASLALHLDQLMELRATPLAALTAMPGVFETHHAELRGVAILAYLAVLGWAGLDYAAAMRAGYRIPVHKAATIAASGVVSVLAWGFAPPVVALAVINLYHAVQYFALVWLKEGPRMRGQGSAVRAALIFGGGCAMFGFAYAAAADSDARWILAPFIACSLLHYWYDGFVWSVRRKQV